MQRMNGEKGGHHRARPEIAGHLPQYQEQKDRGSGVEQNVRQMVPAGAKSVKLAIEEVREAGQWVPVSAMAMREHPADALRGQPALNGKILIDVSAVVQVNELMADRLAECQANRKQQQTTDAQDQIAAPRPRR